MKLIRQTRGSLSLSMVFSTAGGLFFLMLFYNLVQYIGTNAALQQAARKAVRCVSPTDPVCVNIRVEGDSSVNQEWFGYQGNMDEDAAVTLDYYQYKAYMPFDFWQADYSTYEIHRTKQYVQWDTVQIPRRTFVPELYEIPSGSIRASFTPFHFEPKYQPNFPSFSQDESLSAKEWLRQQTVPFLPAGSGPMETKTIYPGREALFTVGPIYIPHIQGSTSAGCWSDNQEPCENRAAAGADTETEKAQQDWKDSWKQNAYLAIKVFSQIESLGPSTRVKWGRLGKGPGLFLDIIGKNGVENTICLGGREWSKSIRKSTESQGYNLWLRGPAGAHGGSSASCPGGNLSHDRLRIPRGKSFQIRAYLKTHAAEDPAKAVVAIKYYYDDYKQVQGRTLLCEERDYYGAGEQTCEFSKCILRGIEEYQQKHLWGWQEESCEIREEKSELSCENTDKSRPVKDNRFSELEIRALVNSDAWRPSASRPKELGYDLKWCGTWRVLLEKETWEEVPGTAAAYALSRNSKQNIEQCDYEPIVGREKHERSACPQAFKAIDALEARTRDLNKAQPTGAPAFVQQSVHLEWLEPNPEDNHWSFSWLAQDEFGGKLSSAQGNIKEKLESIAESKLLKGYRRNKDGSSKPTKEQLVQAVLEQSSGNKESSAWEKFAANIYTHVLLTKKGAGKSEVSSVFPFTEPVPEIYWGQDGTNRGWDFNRDCMRDVSCDQPYREFDNEQEMLRAFAAAELPQAADTRYQFFSEAMYHATKVFTEIKTKNEAEHLELPACTPTKTICEFGPSEHSELLSLGVSDQQPLGCRDGAYKYCFSRPHGYEFEPPAAAEEFDENLLAQAAITELRRIIPYANLRCSKADPAGCTQVEVAFSEDKHVAVTLRYKMPLSFPLDMLLGRDFLALTQTKQEVLEREMLGWEE